MTDNHGKDPTSDGSDGLERSDPGSDGRAKPHRETDVSEESNSGPDWARKTLQTQAPEVARSQGEGYETWPREGVIESSEDSDVAAPRPVESMREENAEIPMLVCMTGPRSGGATSLSKSRVVLGRNRDEVDIWFTDRAVSRRHAIVERFPGEEFRIRDLESANGTFVNRERLETSRRLESGDKIVLSQEAILKFATPDSVEREFHDRMYESSVRDRLTGANSRAYLEEQMISEIGLAERYSENVEAALLLLDIDNFKEVNDTHGHPAGDEVLVSLTEICQSLIRAEDVFARYGGEEFAVLLRMTDYDRIHEIADRLRSTVELESFEAGGARVDITVSVGGACYEADELEGFMNWVERADQALYEAKESGRNCVRLYEGIRSD